MQDKDVNKYLEAYYENEYDANKHMTFALLFSAILLFLIWLKQNKFPIRIIYCAPSVMGWSNTIFI